VRGGSIEPRYLVSAHLPNIAADAEHPGTRSADDDLSTRLERCRAILSIGPKTLRRISRLGRRGSPWRRHPATRPERRITMLVVAPYRLARRSKPVASNGHGDGLIRVATSAAVQPERLASVPNCERGIDPASHDLAVRQRRDAGNPVALSSNSRVVRRCCLTFRDNASLLPQPPPPGGRLSHLSPVAHQQRSGLLPAERTDVNDRRGPAALAAIPTPPVHSCRIAICPGRDSMAIARDRNARDQALGRSPLDQLGSPSRCTSEKKTHRQHANVWPPPADVRSLVRFTSVDHTIAQSSIVSDPKGTLTCDDLTRCIPIKAAPGSHRAP
jgi:hypothetical protein